MRNISEIGQAHSKQKHANRERCKNNVKCQWSQSSSRIYIYWMQCFSTERSWHNDMLLQETFLVILLEVLLF